MQFAFKICKAEPEYRTELFEEIEEELKKAGLYDKVWMGFAILLSVKSVGIQGDARTVCSEDAMAANFAKLPYGIASVNHVLYDITNKPPTTMEREIAIKREKYLLPVLRRISLKDSFSQQT